MGRYVYRQQQRLRNRRQSSFGGTLSLLPDFGNAGDGIFVSTSDHEIGGPLVADFNVIAGNGRHGLMISGAGTTRVSVRNNFIGVPDPTMLDVLDLGNAVDGIHIDRASTNTIGGTGQFDDNAIAANHRHGVAMRNGSATGGWANLLQRNQIYANTGLGIDLERNLDAADPIPDPLGDPNLNYANHGQNQPWVCSQQAADPAACIGLPLPTFDGTGTTLRWFLSTSPNAAIRVEFFARTATAQAFLGEETYTTDAAGLVAGANCALGVCTSTVGSGTNVAGALAEMTATDITAADVPPTGDGLTGPANNTSELSNPVGIVQPGQLEFSAPVYTVAEAGVTATITVNRINGADGSVTVDFATADGTAQQPADYAAAASPPPLTWADQDSAPKTFAVSITGDLEYEPGANETVQLALNNPTNGATLGAASTAILEIVDDDIAPTISIDDVSQLEGDAGTTQFPFTVSLSNPSSQTITVVANTTPVSATAGSDYSPVVNQTITFTPGEVAQVLVVDVVGDTISEPPSETFTVDLAAPVNATIVDGQGLATIVDDDAGAVFTIDNVTANEGNAGTTAFTFTVTRSQTTGAASVDFATADGTATSVSDYVPAAGTLNFADSVAAQTITVMVNGDATFEPGELFTVNLGNPSAGTTIGQGIGTGTITNDDAQPTIGIGDVSLVEGNAGTTAFTFAIALSNPSKQVISVVANTADGTAAAGSDYVAVVSQPITFNPGQTTQTLTVSVNGDTTAEPPSELFTVALSGAVNATIADGQGLGTIVDDDSGSVFTITGATANEGNAGTTAFTFTVTRSQTAGAATVDFATSDGTATTANNDYTAAAGTLSFADGAATQPITVNVIADNVFEGNEAFAVTLSNPSAGTTIGQGSGTGTITNDDLQPTLAIGDVSQAEGNAGTSAFSFAATLSNPSSQIITVVASTADGSATVADADYAAIANQTITFNPGQTSQTLAVAVNGDVVPEPNENFIVNLGSPTNATIADAQALGVIIDDDSGAVFTVGNVTANEGNAGTTAFTFTVTRSQTAGAASIDFATADGTATTAGNDYAAAAGTLSFADGVATQSISVDVTGDTVVEGDEAFAITLSNPSAGTSIGQGTGTGTIVDDDAVGGSVFSIANVSASEGASGMTAFTFTVTHSQTGAAASVDYATADGSAIAGSDYVATAGTLNFAAGAAAQTFTVNVIGDTLAEADETFTVTLSNPIGGSIGQGAATSTILDDDSAAGGTPNAIATPALDARGLGALLVLAGLIGAGALRRRRAPPR